MNKLRLAVIGCGNISAGHLKNLRASPHFEVVGVADVIEAAAKRRATEFNIPRWTIRYQELLADREVDAVLVLTPPACHAVISIAALRAGKHVFCEKPLAMTTTQCRAICREVRRSGRVFLLGYPMRHSRDALNLRRQIQSGRIGRPVFFRDVWALCRGSLSPAIHDAKLGGGVLLEHTHWLDFVNWVFGPAQKVYATMARFKPDGTTADDTLAAIIAFASGDQAVWSESWAAKGFGWTPLCVGRPVRPTTDVIGPKGSLHFPGPDGRKVLSLYLSKDQSGKPTREWEWEGDWGCNGEAYRIELEHFHDCIRNRAKPLCTAEDGLAAIALAEAIRKSSRMGKAVMLSP
jgi:predicted dehydrogenase